MSLIESGGKLFSSRLLNICLAVPAMLLLMLSTAEAQVLYGSLTGNVLDQSGAAIPGAKITVLNVGTGASRDLVSDERGAFLISDLQPGVYRVTISSQGFSTLAHEGVNISANTIRRVDSSMQVSQIEQSVHVTAEMAALQTDRSDVSAVQNARQINDLPLTGSVGRNYQSLMGLIPGAIGAGEQNSQAGSPQRSISFNINGVSRLQNNTRIDGSSVVYPWLPTNTAYVPPAEGIEEVNIVTNSFDAEQGMAGGAAVNVIIKSGTNRIHGSGWMFDTNSATQARNYFQTTPTVPKQIVANYGYAVGGPIIKNKLFFFTDFERSTQRQFARVASYNIAPASLRPNASGAVDFTGTGATIYDPSSNADPTKRTPFANNVVPASRIDVAAIELMKRMPLPTGSGYVSNFSPTGVAEFNRNNWDVKINYNASSKLTLFGRYSISPHLIYDPPLLGESGGGALNGGQLGEAPGRTQIAGFGGTYTFSPNMVLDANIGYTRQRLGAEWTSDLETNVGLDILKIPGTNGPDREQGGTPSFQITNWNNLGNDNTGNPFLFRDNQYVSTWNLSWVKKSHNFRFGFDYQNQQINHFQPQGGTFQTVRGTFQFNGNATRLQNGPTPSDVRFNSWADFLLGLPSGAGKVDQLRNPNSIYMLSYALYARDHWQISRQLTLVYGMRWERMPFPQKDNTGMNRFDPSDGNVYTGGLSNVDWDTGATTSNSHFLPRVGFAYRMGSAGKTVIRGGYGMSLDIRPFIDFRNAYPIVNVWAMPQIAFNGATNPFIPVTTLRQGLVNSSAPPDMSKGILPLPANSGTTTYPKDEQRKYIQSWNLTVERELPWKLTAQAAYVATRAVGQMQFININAAAPGTGNAGRALARFGLTQDINEILPYQTATYDGLQTQLRRRWAGSSFGVNYTWSKAINYADNDSNPRVQYYPEALRNRGPAGYDRTHVFTTFGVWDLPMGKGQRWANSGIVNVLLGGFQLNGILGASSGAPIWVVQGTAGNLNAPGSSQISDQIAATVATYNDHLKGTPPSGGSPANYQFFDRSAFAAVSIPSGQAQRFGNTGRNSLRGPKYVMLDLGLFRNFRFTEWLSLQFRAEALNALNHPNFSNPGADVSSSGSFGYITSTTGQGSRIFRFAARLVF